MNRRPPGLLLSRCITGFLQYKMAEGLRPRTIDSYRRRLESWVAHAGDVQVESLTTRDLRCPGRKVSSAEVTVDQCE
jgi:hypothetical protein